MGEGRRREKSPPHLGHLPLVALVGAGDVVGEGRGAGEIMVAAGSGDDVAMAGDLPGEAGDGAGDCRTEQTSGAVLVATGTLALPDLQHVAWSPRAARCPGRVGTPEPASGSTDHG